MGVTTHTHTLSAAVASDVHRHFDFSLATIVSIFSCSRALAISLIEAVIVVTSQYCSISSLHPLHPIGSCVSVDLIFFNSRAQACSDIHHLLSRQSLWCSASNAAFPAYTSSCVCGVCRFDFLYSRTGTFRYAPSMYQPLTSSNSTATVSSGVSTHRIKETALTEYSALFENKKYRSTKINTELLAKLQVYTHCTGQSDNK